MKKLPKQFTVFGKKIQIVTKTDKLTAEQKFFVDTHFESLYGLYMDDHAMIWINPKNSLEIQWRTLYHELGHALMYRVSLPYGGEFPQNVHEVVVESYGNFIYEVFHPKE